MGHRMYSMVLKYLNRFVVLTFKCKSVSFEFDGRVMKTSSLTLWIDVDPSINNCFSFNPTSNDYKAKKKKYVNKKWWKLSANTQNKYNHWNKCIVEVTSEVSSILTNIASGILKRKRKKSEYKFNAQSTYRSWSMITLTTKKEYKKEYIRI